MVFPVHRDECDDSCINYMLKNPHSSKNDGDHRFKYFIKITQCRTDKVDPLDNERFINFTRILESLEWSSKLSLSFFFFLEKWKPSIVASESKGLIKFPKVFFK